MSKVEKLSIRGIRNFSVEQEVKIKFDTPLTLITGQNGVGKTTVIECLRYITTGEFPPNSDRGKFFVHDPLVKEQGTVVGCVKGQFADSKGRTVTIRRSAELSKYDKSLKLKTKDTSVSVYDKKTDKIAQLTNRCGEADNEATHALGVSSAILNNVIFCHQDDANWPLEDCKVLKERFDAILDTTSYIKALETIRKHSKTKAASLRVMEAKKEALRIRAHDVTSKKEKLKELKVRKEEIDGKVNEIGEKLIPIKKRLEEVKQVVEEVQKRQLEDEKERVQYGLAKKQCETLLATLKDIFDGTDEELAESLASYDATLEEKKKRISAIENEIQQTSEIEQKYSKMLNEGKIMIATLNQQLQENDKKLQQRNQAITTALELWKLDTVKDFDDDDAIQRAIDLIEKKTHELERSLHNQRLKQDEDENLLEKKVEVAREKRAKINSDLKRSEQEMEDLRSRIKNIRAEVQQSNSETLDTKLTSIDNKISQCDDKIKQLNELMKSEDVEVEIAEKSRRIEELENDLTRLDQEMPIVQNQNSLNIKLESLKSNAKSKNEEIDKLKQKHEANLKKLLSKDQLPDCDLVGSIEGVQKILSQRLDKLQEECKGKEYNLMMLSASLEQAKKELDTKIADNQVYKDKIEFYCKDYKNYEDTLRLQQTKVKALQNKRGMVAQQGVAYNEYIKELNRNSCCALCERNFASSTDAKKLSKKLEKAIGDLPSLLKQCEVELETEQKKYDTLLSLETIFDNCVKFEKERRELQKTISEKERELEEAEKKNSELKELKSEPTKKIELIKAMIPDLRIWDHYSQDLMQIALSIDELQEEMSSFGRTTNKTMDEMHTEREVLKKTIKDIREDINNLRSRLDTKKEELRQATEKRTQYLEEQLKLQKYHRDLARMKDELKASLDKDAEVRASLQDLRQALVIAEEERDQVVRQLDELKSKNREERENERRRAKEFEKQWETLRDLQKDITLFSSKNIDKKMASLEIEVTRCTEMCEKKRRERVAGEEELRSIKDDLSGQESKKRNLTDNIELRKLQKMIQTIAQSRRQRETKIANLNYDQICEEKSQLIEEQQRAEKEIIKATGSTDEIKSNIRELTEELKSPEAQEAVVQYKKMCLETLLTKYSIQDMNTYAEALEETTSDYHQERLSKINSAMKRLWKLIYVGTDTTSIEIKAEPTVTNGKTDRRQFNYKLVQTKHDIEMEMRGRCSAGQRVLASIILRLALAETLSEHTGMLALDEPTTNLDAENARKLADTLYKYISLRAEHEKNFQLVIITHDEQFISRLTELSANRYRQELYRDEQGFTKVRKMELLSGTQYVGDDSDSDFFSDNGDGTNAKPSRKRARFGDNSTSRSKRPYNFDINF
uniref:Rad50/SbcC-type AAA domain-containing protein n=1 Tax=Bracon brevicornis TaxID=1563983 RepID=A0A6V7I671_9HYME